MIRNAAYAILLTFAVAPVAELAHATDRNDLGQNSPVQPSPVQHSPALSRPGNFGNAGGPGNSGGPGNYGNPVSPANNGGSSFSNSGNSNCPDCPKPRQHYDTQEVVHTAQDVDQSRVINTTSVVPVAPRMKETNHLVIRKNTIRNVGVVRHNHTIIEKEIRYKRPVQRSKVVGYVVQEYQTVYKPAIVYVPYTYPVRYSVPHHYYPKQYHYPQHHYQQSCCQQQHQYPQPYYPQHDYYRTGLLQWRS